MTFALAILAVLSIWDYPARFPEHRRLSRQFVSAVREGDTETMEETCRKGVKLLPDDPTWHFNLACSLAYFNARETEAFAELEKAIDLGFRDREKIASDADLKRLAGNGRYGELLEYATLMSGRPLLSGPMATVDATGVFGRSIALGAQNLGWDFDHGCFVAQLRLVQSSAGGNEGDLYMNRDCQHASLAAQDCPGLTFVSLDQEGRGRGMDCNEPNILFPYPVFGNCSRAFVGGKYWRSISRSLTTTQAVQIGKMLKFYLSNQTWVFPSNADTAPVGTNGDVFASITPYWITTAGRSWSDLPYLRAALLASRTFRPDVKRALTSHGLLAPTIQTLIRKTLRGVADEEAYLGAAAHPTAFPPGGADTNRLVAAARAMTVGAIPPLAAVDVLPDAVKPGTPRPELTYGSAFAWAFVLRADEERRTFRIRARGAREFAFVQTHGTGVDVRIVQERPDVACVEIDRRGMSPTNRVDIMVCGRNPGTGWGAPSYVSFARMDASAPYSDPVLTVLPQPTTK